MAEYPEWVVVRVCDPVHGLATTLEFMPTPKNVRDACAALMVMMHKRMAYEKRVTEQFNERKVDRSLPRQSVAEIKAEMAERGLDTSKWRE